MPEYNHPGVYVAEIPSSVRPIDGVATSITAFVGETFRNSDHEPAFVTSMSGYLSVFGPILFEDDHLSLAVQAFFFNGGDAAYICPLAKNSTKGIVALSDKLKVEAKNKGRWSEKVFVKISNVKDDKFDMDVGIKYDEKSTYFDQLETYQQLSVNAGDNFVEKVIESYSSYITVKVADGVTEPPENTNNLGVNLKGGDQTSPVLADFEKFYDNLQISEINIMVLPGQVWEDNAGKDVIEATRQYCEKTNRMLIFDIPEDIELNTINKVRDLSLPTSSYAALYYPWCKVLNPIYHPYENSSVDESIYIAPSSIAAGLWARTDSQQGVWKAPAGAATQLAGTLGLKFHIGNSEQDQLNPRGVNCIRNFPSIGTVLWGARTLAMVTDEWRYISVRRTAIYIEESIYNATRWVVFEHNDQTLWSSLKSSIDSFMNELFSNGALQGTKQSDAYFVRCGLGDTMTPADIDAGRVIVNVGFAPVKPAEFIIIRIQKFVNQNA